MGEAIAGGGPFLGAHSWGGDSHAGAACLRDQHFEQTRVSGPVYQGGGRAPCWPLFMNHSLVLSKGRPWGSTAHTARGLENRPPASGDGGLACGSCPLAPWPVGVMTCGPGWGLVFGASDTTPLPPPHAGILCTSWATPSCGSSAPTSSSSWCGLAQPSLRTLCSSGSPWSKAHPGLGRARPPPHQSSPAGAHAPRPGVCGAPLRGCWALWFHGGGAAWDPLLFLASSLAALPRKLGRAPAPTHRGFQSLRPGVGPSQRPQLRKEHSLSASRPDVRGCDGSGQGPRGLPRASG